MSHPFALPCEISGDCMFWHHYFKTKLGWIGLLVEERQVVALSFGTETKTAAKKRIQEHATELGIDTTTTAQNACQESFAKQIEQRLIQFAAGQRIDLARIPVRIHAKTPFQHRVLSACLGIPRGETLSYGQLAEIAGSPNACRAVGNIMAGNRVPLIIPCHRVVSSSGVGGFSAPQGIGMKERLLALEGIGE